MSEKTILNYTQPQVTNLGYYLVCTILMPIYGVGIILFLIRFIKTKFTKFEITNERIIQHSGVFSKTTNETELYRVKDIKLNQPLFLRIFGLSEIILVTTDKTSPSILLNGVKNGNELRNELRIAVEARRDKKGVIERDNN